jgi:hypothetical protein
LLKEIAAGLKYVEKTPLSLPLATNGLTSPTAPENSQKEEAKRDVVIIKKMNKKPIFILTNL